VSTCAGAVLPLRSAVLPLPGSPPAASRRTKQRKETTWIRTTTEKQDSRSMACQQTRKWNCYSTNTATCNQVTWQSMKMSKT